MPAELQLLPLVRPFVRVLPSIQGPTSQRSFDDRAMCTFAALCIFLVCSHVPLFGPVAQTASGNHDWMRVIMASNRGTLMELGVSPIVTSGFVMQLLVGCGLVRMDKASKTDQELFHGAQQLVGLLVTLAEALVYVLSGMYGDVHTIGPVYAVLIVLQLLLAGVLVITLDDLLQKGYGFGSGISLFIATNVCESIVWKSLSPATVDMGKGVEIEGAVIAFFHLIVTRADKALALKEAFYRQHLPNMTNLLATMLVFVVVIYFQGFRVDLPLKNHKQRGGSGTYPIKLFYTSNTPIILQTALVSNFYFVSQTLYNRYNENPVINLLGQWRDSDQTQVPVGGLSYLISPPGSLLTTVEDPFRALCHIVFMLATCTFLSKAWLDVSGSSVSDVHQQLTKQGVTVSGYRQVESRKVLNRYIPIAAAFGGLCIGVLSLMADFMGAIGSGTGILLTVGIIFEYYEIFVKEMRS